MHAHIREDEGVAHFGGDGRVLHSEAPADGTADDDVLRSYDHGRHRGLQDRGGEERRCSAARHERYLSACAAEGREMRRCRAGGATNALPVTPSSAQTSPRPRQSKPRGQYSTALEIDRSVVIAARKRSTQAAMPQMPEACPAIAAQGALATTRTLRPCSQWLSTGQAKKKVPGRGTTKRNGVSDVPARCAVASRAHV